MIFGTSFGKRFEILLDVPELFQVISLVCNRYFQCSNYLNIQPLDHSPWQGWEPFWNTLELRQANLWNASSRQKPCTFLLNHFSADLFQGQVLIHFTLLDILATSLKQLSCRRFYVPTLTSSNAQDVSLH